MCVTYVTYVTYNAAAFPPYKVHSPTKQPLLTMETYIAAGYPLKITKSPQVGIIWCFLHLM